MKIAVNNVGVSNSLYKEFQRKGLEKLWAPVADGLAIGRPIIDGSFPSAFIRRGSQKDQ